MTVATISVSARTHSLLLPILVGGGIAGTLDLASAFLTFGWGTPRFVTAGLLGQGVVHGGAWVWILGVVLHYTIAFSAAAVYCLASRRLPFLRDHWLVCGLFFGIAVFLVMNLVVLPLCALHSAGPYQYRGLMQGILFHMFIIGLPISFSLRRLSR